LPNDLTSHVKGKVVRASNETLWGARRNARGYVDLPMSINDYISTLWIGSPCLVADSTPVESTLKEKYLIKEQVDEILK
jgi:hypothetical protein